jgi:hypothetical protein
MDVGILHALRMVIRADSGLMRRALFANVRHSRLPYGLIGVCQTASTGRFRAAGVVDTAWRPSFASDFLATRGSCHDVGQTRRRHSARLHSFGTSRAEMQSPGSRVLNDAIPREDAVAQQ